MIQTVDLLKNLFPGQKESYYEVLARGIKDLSKINIGENSPNKIGHIHPIESNHWKRHFKKLEFYYKELCSIWPVFTITRITEELIKARNFDQYLNVYRRTQFGFFLANTKTLVSLHSEFANDWSFCYESWIGANTSVIHAYTGLSWNMTNSGVRLIVNEVILKPDIYHQIPEEFKHLVKRQYQLLLTEQNC